MRRLRLSSFAASFLVALWQFALRPAPAAAQYKGNSPPNSSPTGPDASGNSQGPVIGPVGKPEHYPRPDPSMLQFLLPAGDDQSTTPSDVTGSVNYGAPPSAAPPGARAGNYESDNRFQVNIPQVGPPVEADPRGARGQPPLARSQPSVGASPSVQAPILAGIAAPAQRTPIFRPPIRDADGKTQAAALIDSAESKMHFGDLAGALMDLSKALSLWPRSAKAYLLEAQALNRLRRFDEAAEAAHRSLSLEESAKAYESLALAELNLGQYERAVLDASKAIALKPRGAEAYAIRALAYEQLGMNDLKLADLTTADAVAQGRFAEYVRMAKAGKRLFLPGVTDSLALLEALSVRPGISGRWLGLAGMLVLALGLSAGAAARKFLLKDRGELLAGKYRLAKEMAPGGSLWEAMDCSLKRKVMVQRVMSDGPSRDDRLEEARSLASLHHPNIVDLYEVLDLPSGMYLVFELVRGKTVDRILAEARKLTVLQARGILGPVCQALGFARGQGIGHKDLKLSNIMVSEEGTVKVVGFDISGRGAGSRGGGEGRALGACLYELLSGKKWPGLGNGDGFKAAALAGIAPRAGELILRSLDPDPAAAIPDPADFLKRLESLS